MADTVDQIMSQLDQYYKPQSDIVNQQLAALPGQTAQQVAGLDQAKTNAFSDITAGANSRGVLYSGMPIQEQAKYTGATYLPALANLQKAQTDQQTSLQGKLADIKAQQGQQAYSIRNDQLKAEQAAAQAAADRQQQMQIEQMRIAAQRSTAAAKGPSASAVKQGDMATIAQALNGVKGHDGFVSPQSFAQARQEWTSAGYSAAEFNSAFKNYANLTYGPTSYVNYGLK